MRAKPYDRHNRDDRMTMRQFKPTATWWMVCLVWIMGSQTGWALSRNVDRLSISIPTTTIASSVFRLPSSEKISQSKSIYETFLGHFHSCQLEKRLLDDASDGRLDEYSLASAALIASGATSVEQLGHYEHLMAGLVAELENTGTLPNSPRDRAQAIFEFMHNRVLHAGYRIDCTSLATALDEGRFNCVSASVLYVCLTRRLGITVRGLETPGHTMSRLHLPDGTLEVETTCPKWFDMIDDPEKRAELIKKTIGVSPNATFDKCREVSGVELVATIYYNQGVDLLNRKYFKESLTANMKALRLDPSSRVAQGNLLATVNNWAIELGTAHRYSDAVNLLEKGFLLQPHYKTFDINYIHVHHCWVERLCKQGRFQKALDVLTQAAIKRPNEPYFNQAKQDVLHRWARNDNSGHSS